MNGQAAVLAQSEGRPTSGPAARGMVLQRQCACGQHTAGSGECEACKKKREGTLQRAAASPSPIHDVPPIVHEVLRSPGWYLAPATRSFMEPRFGRDFSDVRVHADEMAARSARTVSAPAFTVGHDVVFGAGQYAPHSSAGRRLLAHELGHVIQQDRATNAAGGVATTSVHEAEASTATVEVVAGRSASVTGIAAVGLACAPRSLEVSLNPTSLRFTELEQEIKEIEQYLDSHQVSSVETDNLAMELEALRAELARRRKDETRGEKRRSRQKTSANPRSLNESLRTDETLPDAELHAELDAIHDALRAGVSKQDRAILKTALAQLEAEKGRREGVVAAQARAQRIQHAFEPKVTTTDGDALAEVMGVVESIRPSETTRGMYTLYRDGELLAITREEYDRIRSASQKILLERLPRIRSKAVAAEMQYKYQDEVNKEHRIVSGVVHFFGGIDDPGLQVGLNVGFSKAGLEAAKVSTEKGQLKRGADFFAQSEKFATIAKKLSQDYVDEIISTAGTIVDVLEITRDAAFATTLALGAVVAAPVVAAGVAGAGATGATATVLTAAGTGLVVGTEGAVLRGGSAAGGMALAGGSGEEILSAAKSEGWRGAKEGFATGVGGSVARSAGAALKVGGSSSTVVNVARGSVAQGLGNAAGSATGSALEGGSVVDIAKSGTIGFGVGTLTGPLSHGAGVIKNPVAAAVARTGVGALASGGQTYLETRNREAAWRSAAVGGASALAVGLSKPGQGSTTAEQKAFEAGQALRAKGQSAVRTVRNVTAAAMLGVSDAVPAARGTGAEVGGIVGRPVPGLVQGAEKVAGSIAIDAETSPQPPPAKQKATVNDASDGAATQAAAKPSVSPESAPVRGPEIFAEISQELSLAAPGADAAPGIAGAVADAQVGGFVGQTGQPGSIDVAVQPHGQAPAVRQALGIVGASWQSAHIGPTSALRGVPGYSRTAAETTLLPEATHRAFDRHWQQWAMQQRRNGRTTASVAELHQAMLNAIDQIPGVTLRTRGTIAWRLQLELYRDLGLRPTDQITLPYPNIGP